MTATQGPILKNLRDLAREASSAADILLGSARETLRARLETDGRISAAAIEADQCAVHAFSWVATYCQALAQMARWADALAEAGKFGETEQLILQIGFGEYLSQLKGGIPMSQGEIARLSDLGLPDGALETFQTDAVTMLSRDGNTQAARTALCAAMQQQMGAPTFGATGLDDDLEMVRDQFRRFADDKVVPNAHQWHLNDELIPLSIIAEMADLGVFGLTIPEAYGGFGFPKAAMCVVSEELSRGYIGVGSLGTRSEIAAELILCGGTEAQKEKWLPKISAGTTLPTAVFTEPNTGSDLGALRTRAVKEGDDYLVTGNKTWITHAARTHVMTLLARTDQSTDNYAGLSMFLAEKTPGTDESPFPTKGMTCGEIKVRG